MPKISVQSLSEQGEDAECLWAYEPDMRLFLIECGFGPIEADIYEDIDYNFCPYCGDKNSLN